VAAAEILCAVDEVSGAQQPQTCCKTFVFWHFRYFHVRRTVTSNYLHKKTVLLQCSILRPELVIAMPHADHVRDHQISFRLSLHSLVHLPPYLSPSHTQERAVLCKSFIVHSKLNPCLSSVLLPYGLHILFTVKKILVQCWYTHRKTSHISSLLPQNTTATKREVTIILPSDSFRTSRLASRLREPQFCNHRFCESMRHINLEMS
jgi:hypothetical protein